MNTLSPAQGSTELKPFVKELLLVGDPHQHKSIFVFLDGTANNPQSGTNVWRLFELLKENQDPQTTALYIEGVGSMDNPLWLKLPEEALGRGMEKRILTGYDFITRNYKPGDDIYLFGFSRGAHEARSLAGFLAYAGVPTVSIEKTYEEHMKVWNEILERTKDKSDEDYLTQWTSWKPSQQPLLASEIKNQFKLEMQTAEITFLGVWDTVPGSSFKNFDSCKEKRSFVKRWLSSLPRISKGERYKSDSYPVIRHIAHAVSLDEKRSKFKPLLVCEAINPAYTKISEMWFPGAHADVGGGYDDSDKELPSISLKGLPGISLNWMLGLLAKSYSFNRLHPVEEDAKGLAHCSICDSPGNTGSKYEDRPLPEGAQFHLSVQERENAGPVPVLVEREIRFLPYQVNSFQCPCK